MTEVYSKSVDFGGLLAPGQFDGEVRASSIATTLLYVEVIGDVVNVVFVSTISAGDKTTLDGLVAAHVPAPTNSIDLVPGYIELNSTLADVASIRINASDAAGGIAVDAGTGGIAITTTNALSLDAAAACNFTTTVGNLLLKAAGVLDLESTGTGSAGINLGTDTVDQTLNLGTGSGAKSINIGNTTTTTGVDVDTGTGGFIVDTASGGAISLDATGASSNLTLTTTGDAQDLTIALAGSNDSSLILDSQGTGADSIRLNTTGGIDADATGVINIATGSSAGGAITLDAAFNNGGITVSAGTQGIAINSNGGLIGIGHWNGGNIQIGTAAVARTLTLGNTTTTTSVVVNSGTGGITIGNDANGGDIQVGNVANAKTLTVGNNTGASRLFTRWGTNGNVKTQIAETALSNGDATLTMTQLFTQILTMSPTTDRTLTLPTAADAVAAISGVQINDCFDFTIIHESTGASDPFIIIAMGTGGTAVGFMDVHPKNNNAGTYFYSGSGTFRLRFTNVTVSSEAYTVYRIG